MPDNVLFEGGAGETVRRRLLRDFDVHTLLRLPTGILYAGGVKANVLFFDRPLQAREGQVRTETLWVYDFRTAQNFTLKQRPLCDEHLKPFLDAYRPGADRTERQASERWKPFRYDELVARGKANLDITWLKEPSLVDADEDVPPEIIAREIVEDLQAALLEFETVATALEARAAERGARPEPEPPAG